MTTKIRLLPSDHEFELLGKSSLLEAGLSAGHRLAYGCSSGNCGKCLVRVVEGEVEKIRHHDFFINEVKKASGQVLMCCNTALTDLVLEADEASNANEIPQQQVTARVKNVNFIGNVALLHLKTPRISRLRFLAGQHVELGGNGIPSATHTVASCPCDDQNLHFQILRETENEFSNHVFSRLKSGDRLDVNGPSGSFILDEDSARSLVFIAWHTGFAPIRSLIEQAMALELADAIHLIWIAENKQDRYLDNLCRSWADALDDFYYVPVDSNLVDIEGDINHAIERLDIEQECLATHDFYIAGNRSLLDLSAKALLEYGVALEQLNQDPLLHN
jgi:CDP-4-dehydro-6-deoxyglucose reductase